MTDLWLPEQRLNTLLKRFNDNIAVVSGRSKLAAEYSLKPILDTFNQRACVYLEDEKSRIRQA